MKRVVFIFPFFFIFALYSCKKDYTCMCSDPRIDTTGFVIHDTKSNARKQCADTKNPFNDAKCSLYK